MAILKNTRINSTESITLPVGTSSQRPGSPGLGMMRYNTDEEYVEVYNGEEWVQVASGNDIPTALVKTNLQNDSSVNNSSSFSNFNVFNNTIINEGSFSVSSSGISIPDDGIYLCSLLCKFTNTDGNSRTAPATRFSINGSAQGEISCSSYMRASSGHEESSNSLTTIYSLTSGDTVGLQFSNQGQYTGTSRLDGGNSTVMIERIG